MFRVIPDGENYREFVLLKDGASVLIRAATPADVPVVEELLKGLSRQSLQMRFMGGVTQVSRRFVEDLCNNDPKDRYCILAIQGEEPNHKVIGLGNYIGLGGRRRAEVAFMVADEHQGRGIGTLVLERIAGVAAANGYVGFEAEVLFENQKMIGVFRSSGFEAKQAFEGGSIHVEFPVDGAAALRERTEVRDRVAAANSLIPLLRPKSLAVVGASRDSQSIGSLIFQYILRGSFRGTVYPVNSQAASVSGVKAYPSLQDLPEAPDLVVVAVPAKTVLEVAEHAIEAGAKALLVVSSGFAEAGPEGAELQAKLVEYVRSQGARLVGPNCLGLVNTGAEVRLNASLAPRMPPLGRVGFYSHSAALGLVIMDHAAERGIGFSTFVSAGNRADVSGNDLLQYWEEDPETDMALLYLETFGNPRKFARVARRVSRRKPILCVKSARSRAGRHAARAHRSAPTQSDNEVDVLFRQVGVIRANTLDEMFDVAVLLETQPLPAGDRVAIVSNSGGVVTICADACETNGLTVLDQNIVELGTLCSAEAFETAVRETLQRDDVDALLVIYACVGEQDPQPMSRAIRRGVAAAEKAMKGPKPVLLCLMGTTPGAVVLASAGDGSETARRTFPAYLFPESAAMALGRVAQYACFRRQSAGKLLWYEDAKPAMARRRVEAVLEGSGAEELRWLEGHDAHPMLADFGIPTALPSENAEYAEDASLRLTVRTDPHFGPLIDLRREGSHPIERITPLMDTDARAMVDALGLSPDGGIEELLGRVSQLVEELPWVQELHADVVPPDIHGAPGPAILTGEIRVGLKRV
jgi:acetate---CoA ligase (ADP-forming)